MSTTWDEVNEQLSIFMDDDGLTASGDEGEFEYSQQQRIAAWNQAQHLLVSHTPRECFVELVINSDERSAELPDDFYKVRSVYLTDDQRWSTPMRLPVPGAIRYENGESNLHWTWGRRLLFERTVQNSEVELYYWGYWPKVTYRENNDEVDLVAQEITVPPWSVLALCHLTAATCLQPGAIQAARIRQWNIKVDSGTPVDNARAAQAWEHWKWWREILNSVPPKDLMGDYSH